MTNPSAPAVPRAEHPRPQFVRDKWLNLNAIWQFEMDPADTGLERGLLERELTDEILVPFAPESTLSGVGHVDAMNAVWYRREISVPEDWQGDRVLLHFGAVDHDATVWVDGVEVTRHRGGFTGFSADITELAPPGHAATVVVRARDPYQGPQARGKQSRRFGNYECFYTRTTGIWQTVWLEAVPVDAVEQIHIVPHLAEPAFDVTATLRRTRPGLTLRVTVSDADGEVVSRQVPADSAQQPSLRLPIPEERVRPWFPGEPHLYDLSIELVDGDRTVDTVASYAGLRTVTVVGDAVLINGRRVFQRLVLDQGYWPDSLMTAPSDQALIDDIELSMQAGFNGARLHQKVFEERFHYHADRLGYLVWGSSATGRL
ncbi:glycoside hydrolase family 2 protein [Tessaracoccus coleopterorum]|uniref:glycoside hydrolase family 2 protein n=1 Tax=Tessaracoccus coleopterorum TaxID=2714950 RepID=UPI001E6226F3|nr:sugar-binding domain-containing protein [Tessaracoccus coleopterorum]